MGKIAALSKTMGAGENPKRDNKETVAIKRPSKCTVNGRIDSR
jgi:hypothetical protein